MNHSKVKRAAYRPYGGDLQIVEPLARLHTIITSKSRPHTQYLDEEGSTGGFAFGRSRDIIEGFCAAAGLPIAISAPSNWKRLVGAAPTKPGDGRAEAALIAIAAMSTRERA